MAMYMVKTFKMSINMTFGNKMTLSVTVAVTVAANMHYVLLCQWAYSFNVVMTMTMTMTLKMIMKTSMKFQMTFVVTSDNKKV